MNRAENSLNPCGLYTHLHVLDDVLLVVRVEEKAAGFGVGDELEVVVVACHGVHVR